MSSDILKRWESEGLAYWPCFACRAFQDPFVFSKWVQFAKISPIVSFQKPFLLVFRQTRTAFFVPGLSFRSEIACQILQKGLHLKEFCVPRRIFNVS